MKYIVYLSIFKSAAKNSVGVAGVPQKSLGRCQDPICEFSSNLTAILDFLQRRGNASLCIKFLTDSGILELSYDLYFQT